MKHQVLPPPFLRDRTPWSPSFDDLPCQICVHNLADSVQMELFPLLVVLVGRSSGFFSKRLVQFDNLGGLRVLNTPYQAKCRAKGFTLIELIIVVAIVAIIAAVALPAYQGYVRTSYRHQAQMGLETLAQVMERSYARQGVYPTALPAADLPNQYVFTLDATSSSTTTYLLVATPQGSQVNDNCGTLSLDFTGKKSPDGCWQ